MLCRRREGVRHLHDAFVVSDHDCEALGKGIITLLKAPTLAAKLGANARTTVVTNFDCRQICLKIERIYKKMLHASPKWHTYKRNGLHRRRLNPELTHLPWRRQ